VVGALQILLVLGFLGFGRALWLVSKEIQSRKNVKSSSPDFGDQETSSPAIRDESVPEKTFANFVIISLYVLVVVIGLPAIVLVGLGVFDGIWSQ
jgi:hypothetical protein